MSRYRINEIFWSPQGEGMRAGEMSAFVRFTGCNLRCAVTPSDKSPGGFDCDTEFESGRSLSVEEIVHLCRIEIGKPDEWLLKNRPWIVFTGGEPGLQLDRLLVDRCHDAGFRCAIETNGSLDVSYLGLDWITVSPKVAEHAVKQVTADEVKYVRGYGQAVPKPSCKATYQLISPATIGNLFDQRAVEWCIGLIRDNPEWRLSCQLHKQWLVR